MPALRLLAILCTLPCVLVPLGCGSNEGTVASVGDAQIERESVESLIELYKSRAEAREGESGEKGKEKVSHVQEVAALQVLVQRAVLEQKARQLGVTVDPRRVAEATERLRGSGKTEEDKDEEGLDKQIRDTARAQLLHGALYKRVTRSVSIPRSEVLTYYRQHRSSYPGGGSRPKPEVERTIRRGLTAIERDQAMARWVARTQREFAAKIHYEDGWAPPRR
jgi:hypothetical protein